MLRIAKQQRFNLWCITISLVMYSFNRLLLMDTFDGLSGFFFHNYFNDILCPLVILPSIVIIMNLAGISIKSSYLLFVIIAFCAIIWEYIIPIVKETSVSDIHDVACYCLGWGLYCAGRWAYDRFWRDDSL